MMLLFEHAKAFAALAFREPLRQQVLSLGQGFDSCLPPLATRQALTTWKSPQL